MDNRIRRVNCKIEYRGKDVTKHLTEYLKDINVTDNFEGKLDSVELKFYNKKLQFLKPDWALQLKEEIKVALYTENYESFISGEKSLPLGIFYIDDRNFSATELSIKAISTPLDKILDQKNSRFWEEITLKELASEISKIHNIELQYLVKENLVLHKVKQDRETDLNFLNRIVKDEGLSIKVNYKKIIIFDKEIFENKDSKIEISLNGKYISENWSIREKTKDIYDRVEISYQDLKTNKTKKVVYTKNGEELRERKEVIVTKKLRKSKISKWSKRKNKKPKSKYIIKKKTNTIKIPKHEGEKTLKIQRNSASGDLKKFALKKLKEANRKEIEFKFTIIGELKLTAGSTFYLKDAGIFNGKYIIDSIRRSLNPFKAEINAYLVKLDGDE